MWTGDGPVELHDLGRWTVAEAQVLGIPENTVYSRLHRAKDHLREAFARLSGSDAEHGRALQLLTGEK